MFGNGKNPLQATSELHVNSCAFFNKIHERMTKNEKAKGKTRQAGLDNNFSFLRMQTGKQ